MHKAELQAFLEDHSPDVVTLNETFTKQGYKYNMPHYTAVTRNREHRKGRGVAILLRQDLAFTEIDDIQLTKTTDNEQLTVAIRTDSELYVSTVYCPHGNPSTELIDGLCENRDQVILTGDFNCKHPELGNDQTNSSGTRLTTVTQNNNLTLINDGTPTYTNASGKEDVNDLIFISQPTVPNFRDFWVGDDNGSDHFIINGVFSYKPIYNNMNAKTVRLFHNADWIDTNFAIRSTMTKTTLNKMTLTEDEIDKYVDKLTNTITSAIAEKVPTKTIKRNSIGLPTEIRELIRQKTPEETLAKDQNTAVQDKRYSFTETN